MVEEKIVKYIEDNKKIYIEFLQKLIQTKSYNPPGNEKNVAQIIKEYLENSNISCEIFPFGNNRANLIAFLNCETNSKNLLYNGHMDVVPPGNLDEWSFKPLSGMIKRKKMFGRGTTDMKGGLAAMVIALTILKNLNLDLSGNLIVNAVADEETGGKFGTKWCLENIFKPRSIKVSFCIIGEATGLNPLPKSIILGEKGHLQLKLVTNGISCHSSIPFLGKNAIYMMSEIIQNFDKLDKYVPEVAPPMSQEKIKKLVSVCFPSYDRFEQVLNEQELLKNIILSLTKFTKSLNMIEGGIKENVIPDRCEAIMDFRLLPGQPPETIINGLKKLISEDLEYEVRDDPNGAPEDIFVYIEVFNANPASYWDVWEDSEDLKLFYDSLKEVYKRTPFYFLFPACADAHYYRNTGFCPKTILFGPGNASTAHATDENIEIADFINAIKTYTIFAYRFLKKN